MNAHAYREQLAAYMEATQLFRAAKARPDLPDLEHFLAVQAQKAMNAAANLHEWHKADKGANACAMLTWDHLANRWLATMLKHTELPNADATSATSDKPIAAAGTTP